MGQNWLLEIFESSGWQGEPKLKFNRKKIKYLGFSLEYEYHAFLMTSGLQGKLIETIGDLNMEDPETGDMVYLSDVSYDGNKVNEDEGTIIFNFTGKQVKRS